MLSTKKNLVRESTATAGTGAVTLAALTGWARFSQAYSVGDVVPYTIANGDNKEVGLGTVGAGDTLARTTVLATLVGGVYDDTAPVAITLSGTSTVLSGPLAELYETADTAGQLSWRYGGDGYVIFDASASTKPDGSYADPKDPLFGPWAPNHPTLVGWDGGFYTYGVRVDTSKVAEGLTRTSPNGVIAPSFACRAWAILNGTEVSTNMIRNAGNVSSVTDNGVGDYGLNFAYSLYSTDYSHIAVASSTSAISTLYVCGAYITSASGVRVIVKNYATGVLTDVNNISFAAFY